MTAARFYSSVAGAIDLTGSVGSSDTSILVSSTSGLPGTTPFTLVLDPGLPTEEIVNVTNVSGLTLTVTRGVDGSSAQAHAAGVGNVRHMATARDFREPQEHIGSSADVHGVGAGSSVVGTDTVQSLKNKTAEAGAAATPGLVVKGAAGQTASFLDVQDSAGTTLFKVSPDAGGTVQLNGGTATLNEGNAASVLKFASRFVSSATDCLAAVFKAKAGQTADIVQVQKSDGTVLAKVDKDGAITSPTITALQSADTALDTRVSAVESADRPKSSVAKKDKRLHWDTKAVTTGAGSLGIVTVTHGAGFTPAVVVGNRLGTTGSLWRVDQFGAYTATTFDVRIVDGTGGAAPDGTALTIQYFCGE